MGKVWKDKMFACQSQSKGHWIDRSVVLQVLLLNRSPNSIEKTLTSNKIELVLPFSEARWSFDPWCQGDPGAHSCQKRHGSSLESTENVKLNQWRNEPQEWRGTHQESLLCLLLNQFVLLLQLLPQFVHLWAKIKHNLRESFYER